MPSGASTGVHEAHELRDGDSQRYLGKGVLKAVKNVVEELGPAIVGIDPADQKAIDHKLIELDGTKNKSRLGANAILGVSLASFKAAAAFQKQSCFKSLWQLRGKESFKMPVPLMNVLNGGAHADNGLDVQEFMVAPVAAESFAQALRMGSEVFHSLKKLLKEKGLATSVGDEGGFAPRLEKNEEALEFLVKAIESAGYKAGKDFYLALDVAATEFFEGGRYLWEGESKSSEELGQVYESWVSKYPIASIEDGFSEDDWGGWESFCAKKGKKLQLVGDDLFVTNVDRLRQGIDKRSANAILVKVNQIGTLTETMSAIEMAHAAGFRAVMSHRSGETEDSIIADLAVGLGCEQIKTGSLSRSDRMAKYNQLLRIEEELGTKAQFWGPQGLLFS